MTPHPRYSFHTADDGKDGFLNDIEDHRVLIDGRYYWVLRLNPADAASARHHGSACWCACSTNCGAVICAAHLTHCARPGVVHGYESSRVYEPLGEPGRSTDIGGAINLLTPKKPQFARGHAMGNSNCLVEVEPWTGHGRRPPHGARRRGASARPRERAMKKWNLVFDVELCTGCQNCVLAVKDEYVGQQLPGLRRRNAAARRPAGCDIRSAGARRFPAVDCRLSVPALPALRQRALHRAARDDAVKKRADGIVIIDPELAKGQKQIVDACPYGAVHWNEALSLPQHWNFDAHLIDAGWPAPRPVQACPTGALRALKVEDEEMRRIAAKRRARAARTGRRASARACITATWRASPASSLPAPWSAAKRGWRPACRARRCGLRAAAKRSATPRATRTAISASMASRPSSGRYRVEVTAEGYQGRTLEFELADSHWLGEIRLDPGVCRS